MPGLAHCSAMHESYPSRMRPSHALAGLRCGCEAADAGFIGAGGTEAAGLGGGVSAGTTGAGAAAAGSRNATVGVTLLATLADLFLSAPGMALGTTTPDADLAMAVGADADPTVGNDAAAEASGDRPAPAFPLDDSPDAAATAG